MEKCFRGCLWWFGGIWKYIGERIRLGGARGTHKGGGGHKDGGRAET